MWGDREGGYLTAKLPSLRAVCLITNMCSTVYSVCAGEKESLSLKSCVHVCVHMCHMCLEALTNELTL